MTSTSINQEANEQMEPHPAVATTPEPRGPRKRPRIWDFLFILAVVFASALPYLFGLGFYSDDWAFQSRPALHSGGGVVNEFWMLMKTDQSLRVRPVQAAYIVSSFKAFGHNPLPYHVVGAVLIAITAVLLYTLLIELEAGCRLALAISLLYGLSPQYSTDKFWWASQQAVLCMLFEFIGIWAMLRSIRDGAKRPLAWMTLSIFALVLSVLSYEVAIGSIFAALVVTSWRRFRGSSISPKRGIQSVAGVAVAAMVLLAVGFAKSQMQTRFVYNHHLMRFLGRAGSMSGHALAQSVEFNLWSYCLHLPWVIASLWRESALTPAAIASAATIAIAVSVYLWQSKDSSQIPCRGECLRLLAIGFILYMLGTLLFMRDLNNDFSGPGLYNRINIAAALGEPFVWVALLGLASSLLTNPRTRALIFSVMLGLVCGGNCLVVSGIAHYWDIAASRQSTILDSVTANVHSLPNGSVLLLDGFCRYIGPGIVFETSWDVTGAIDIVLKDDLLVGDVVSRNAQFGSTAIDTTMYGEASGHYPYGIHTFVYNVPHSNLTSLTSQQAVIQYLKAMNPSGNSGCPAEEDGDGTKIF